MITLASNVNSRLSALGESTVHLCIDMQRLFGSSGIWPTPWMERVLPIVAAVVNHCPERTVFTRFIPPRDPDEMPGMWQRYYRRWECATRDRVDPELIELHPALGKYTPPAAVIDKTRYSAFTEPLLSQFLAKHKIDTLIVTGSETDVCVMATVLGAVDRGFRVIVVTDAICSSSDIGHDALMKIYKTRYSEQIETARAEDIIASWPVGLA